MKPRILQISHTDLHGDRFNGLRLMEELKERGYEADMLVWDKFTKGEAVGQIFDIRGRWLFWRLFNKIEEDLSLQSMIYPFSFTIPLHRQFASADVVHLHLIHNKFFNLFSLPMLGRRKPVLWTLHDPWAFSGHCVHPYDCERWKTGCGECPRLETHISLKKDRTAFLWEMKRKILKRSDLEIIVASKFMEKMAQTSPLISHFKIHRIPFGIDLNVFKPLDRALVRRKFGIPPENFVIAFRSTKYEFKGLPYIQEALRRLNPDRPVTLLAFNERRNLIEFSDRFQVVEIGWVDNTRVMADAYNACDVFLMPSLQEAFGMMAIEAMACGKPVVVFDGTSLPDTVFAERDGGIVVPYKDSEALAVAIEKLLSDDDYRRKIGENALALVRDNYDKNTYIERIIALYHDVFERYHANL